MRIYSVSEYVTEPAPTCNFVPRPHSKVEVSKAARQNPEQKAKIRRASSKFIDTTSSKLITKLRANKVLCHCAEVASSVATTVQLVCCPMYMDSCLSCDLPIW